MPGRPRFSVEARPVSSFVRRPLEWLWPGRIPLGKIALLSGDPNLGKSLITIEMAARVSADRDWPFDAPIPKAGRALLLAAEDDVADTIRPRLEAAGANLDRVDVLLSQSAGGDRRRPVSLARDAVAIADLADKGNYRLIVIDPITAYLDGSDINDQQEVRGVLSELSLVAERSRAAVVVVNHHRKSNDKGPAIYRTLGAIAFAAVARSAWNVMKDPADPSRRLMAPVKMNLAANPRAIAYRIEDPGLVKWETEPVDVTADEVSIEALDHRDAEDRLREAKIWLHQFLSTGPRRSTDVKAAARKDGIANRALWAAKAALSVKSVPMRNDDEIHYEWRLYHDDILTHEEQAMLMAPTPGNVTSEWALNLLRDHTRGAR